MRLTVAGTLRVPSARAALPQKDRDLPAAEAFGFRRTAHGVCLLPCRPRLAAHYSIRSRGEQFAGWEFRTRFCRHSSRRVAEGSESHHRANCRQMVGLAPLGPPYGFRCRLAYSLNLATTSNDLVNSSCKRADPAARTAFCPATSLAHRSDRWPFALIAAAARVGPSAARIFSRKSIADGIRARAIAVKRACWNSALKAFSNWPIKSAKGALADRGTRPGQGRRPRQRRGRSRQGSRPRNRTTVAAPDAEGS